MGRWRTGWSLRDWVVAGLVVLVALGSIGTQLVVHMHAARAEEVEQAITDVRLSVMAAHGAATRLEPRTVSVATGGIDTRAGVAELRTANDGLAAARRTLRVKLDGVLTDEELARIERRLGGLATTLVKAEAAGESGTAGAIGALVDQLDAVQITVLQELAQIEAAHLARVDRDRWRLLYVQIAMTVVSAVAIVALTSASSRARGRSALMQSSRSALARSEERFRSLVQHSSDVIAIYDRGGVVRYLSSSFERVLGLPVEA